MKATLNISSQLWMTKLPQARQAPLSWKIRNALTFSYIWGLVTVALAKAFNNLTGIPVITSELRAMFIGRDGRWLDYGVVSRRVVTDAGVAYLAADWAGGANDINLFKFHGVGTGTNNEAVGDTALQTESTTILNPDSTRSTGTQTNPTAPVLQSVATALFDGAGAITEHGIFTQAATGGGTLWDRSKFAAINVVSGDSIQFTYQVTFTSGG